VGKLERQGCYRASSIHHLTFLQELRRLGEFSVDTDIDAHSYAELVSETAAIVLAREIL
jgi:hypothetical protein